MKQKQILLVEDNPDDVRLTVRAFEKTGVPHRLAVVSDGAEALEYLTGAGRYACQEAHDSPDVILLDLKIPKVSGLEVLQIIRADERLKLIPVIILTTSNEEKDKVDSYALGANSYLRKPVRLGELNHMAQTFCEYWLSMNVAA